MGQRKKWVTHRDGTRQRHVVGSDVSETRERDSVPSVAPDVPRLPDETREGSVPEKSYVEQAAELWGSVKPVTAVEALHARVLERGQRIDDIERQIKEVSRPGSRGVPGRNIFADKLREEHSRLMREQAAEIPLEEAIALDRARGAQGGAASVGKGFEVPESLRVVEARVRARDREIEGLRQEMREMAPNGDPGTEVWNTYWSKDLRRREVERENEEDVLSVEQIRKAVYDDEVARRPRGWRGLFGSSEARERLASAKRDYEVAKKRGDEVRRQRASRSQNAHENISSGRSFSNKSYL